MERGKVKLSAEERARLREVLDRESAPKVARKWGMYDEPLLRAAEGYSIQRGTQAMIRAGLAKEET